MRRFQMQYRLDRPSSSLTTRQIIGPNGEPVASVGLPYGHSCGTFADVANAELIARAVNSHDELVTACQTAANVLAALATGQLSTISRDSAALAQLRAALAKAKGAP